MTFEEFWKNRHTFDKTLRCTRSEAEFIWNAAKEDKEDKDELVEVQFSKLVGDWLVVEKETGACIIDGFTSELDALNWTTENGYRLK